MDDRLRTLFDKVQSLQCLLDEIPSTQTGKPPRRSKEECRWWARIEEELPQLRDYIATNGPQIEATDPSTSKGLVQAWCKVGELVQQLLEQHADGQPCSAYPWNQSPQLASLCDAIAMLQYGEKWREATVKGQHPDGPTADGFNWRGKLLNLTSEQMSLLKYLWRHRRAGREAAFVAAYGMERPTNSTALSSLVKRLKAECRSQGLLLKISFVRRTNYVTLDVANDIESDTHDIESR